VRQQKKSFHVFPAHHPVASSLRKMRHSIVNPKSPIVHLKALSGIFIYLLAKAVKKTRQLKRRNR